MKIPKIQWDFFPVEYRTFSVDSFFYVSLFANAWSQVDKTLTPKSMDQSTVFDELFNLKTKKILNL